MTLEDYRLVPYGREHDLLMGKDGKPYYAAWITEIPECVAYGDTLLDAMTELDLVFDDYIEAMLEAGLPIAKLDKEIHDPMVSVPVSTPDTFRIHPPLQPEPSKRESNVLLTYSNREKPEVPYMDLVVKQELAVAQPVAQLSGSSGR